MKTRCKGHNHSSLELETLHNQLKPLQPQLICQYVNSPYIRPNQIDLLGHRFFSKQFGSVGREKNENRKKDVIYINSDPCHAMCQNTEISTACIFRKKSVAKR